MRAMKYKGNIVRFTAYKDARINYFEIRLLSLCTQEHVKDNQCIIALLLYEKETKGKFLLLLCVRAVRRAYNKMEGDTFEQYTILNNLNVAYQ